ncbi:type II 3-dehydroquinate dehydratase [Haloflavibacter putidus]|uniref:3-dehydroquinate dehydratase n=1 Tax=Haloflavibacter putidus TaxID=2576776 RepID=A0A507ZRW0_9FLAO|nr:type II 3-dehydroquinate dehydratase [Haloflavibacter putidus]TQD36312.1 type II 3-dehydroquinate dehydratase [Haloflavibacter putidus]
MKILILNGPNLNLLGNREPDVYGYKNFDDYFGQLQFSLKDVELSHCQTNSEGEIIDRLQEADKDFDGIVLNAAAYTHTSIAIADAVKAIKTPVVEVHISNTYAREDFRQKSFFAPHTKGVIIGFGLQSYELAIRSFITK